MKTAVINIKVDPALKALAQKRAKKMGISLSMILHDRLRDFAAGKPVNIELPEEEMTPHLEKLIEESLASGRGPSFKSMDDFIAYLKGDDEDKDD